MAVRYLIPKKPVPAALEQAVHATDAITDPDARDAARAEAAAAVQAFIDSVGVDVVVLPKDVEAQGAAAIEGFYQGQVARLRAEQDAPAAAAASDAVPAAQAA